MRTRNQWILVIAIMVFLDLTAIHLSNVTGNMVSGESRPFSVSEVFSNSLLGDYVYVKGEVKEVLEDHLSEKGFLYQQFIISDGEENIKVFCSTKYGETEVGEGDEILFDGEFKKFYGTLEIYGFCSEVKDNISPY